MKTLITVALVVLLSLFAGCRTETKRWPDRTNKSPSDMLVDVIRWQQSIEVRPSVGEAAYECFTNADLQDFVRNNRAQLAASALKNSHEFGEIADALRSLPPSDREYVFRTMRSIARPTWATVGFVDRTGNGQTEAGHNADLLIANAVVDVFAFATAIRPE